MSETENFHVLQKHRTGRPNHECWDGYAKVYLSNGRCAARCLHCEDIVLNTGKDRLKKHRARCQFNISKQAKRALKQESASDAVEEIIWIDADATEWDGFRQSAEPNINGTYYAQCKNCLTITDALLEDMRAHKENCPMEQLKEGDALYYDESCEEEVVDQEDVINEPEAQESNVKLSPKAMQQSPVFITTPAKKRKKNAFATPPTRTSTIKNFASVSLKSVDKMRTDSAAGNCESCKKPLSRFSDMAKVWERKLDELPLEQALSIEKKMSDMLYEAMITNMQTQKAFSGK